MNSCFFGARSNGFDATATFPLPKGREIGQLAFGGNRFYDYISRTHETSRAWPLMWVQGDCCSGSHITGAQTFFVPAPSQSVRRITADGRTIGNAWSDDHADYALFVGILPADLTACPGAQTTSVFETIEGGLESVGMDFSHVARTWFYNDHLLDWYGEFNVARTAFFKSRRVFDRLIPASTGIGACNPKGAALTAATLAVKPRHHCGVYIREVASPLQCSATEYRSSFARAVEIGFPGRRFLTISGTASIAPGGESVYQGDVEKQIHLTLDVVSAILESRSMGWRDANRAIGYFRDFRDLPLLHNICRHRGIPPLPMAPAHTVVCRDELLFELELDAATAD